LDFAKLSAVIGPQCLPHCAALRFNPNNDFLLNGVAQMSTQLLQAGRTGDIDFDQSLAYQVEPNKPQPPVAKHTADIPNELPLYRSQISWLNGSPDVNIGANIVSLGDATNSAKHMTIQNEHPLVALFHLRQIFLEQGSFSSLRSQKID
jgi:hypothetical protein